MGDREFYLRVWEQEYTNMRHQGNLRWGRLKLFFAVEAGFLYALYAFEGQLVSTVHKIVLAIIGYLIMFVFYLLFKKDGVDFIGHVNRNVHYSDLLEIEPYPDFVKEKDRWVPTGQVVVETAFIVVNICNLVIIYDFVLQLVEIPWLSLTIVGLIFITSLTLLIPGLLARRKFFRNKAEVEGQKNRSNKI